MVQRLVSNARVLSGPVRVLVSNGRVLSAPVRVLLGSRFQGSGPTPRLSFYIDITMRGGVGGVSHEICKIILNCSNVVAQRWFQTERRQCTRAHTQRQRTARKERSLGDRLPHTTVVTLNRARWKLLAGIARSTNNPRARFLVGLKPGRETMQNPEPRQRTSRVGCNI